MTEPPAGWSAPDRWGAPTATVPAPPSVPSYAGAVRPSRVRGVVPLRPLGLGELLDGSVAVVRSYPRPVLAMSAVLAVASALLELIVTLTLLGPLMGTDTSTLSVSSDAFQAYLGTAAIATGLTLLIGAVTGAVLAGVVTVVASRAVLGSGITLRDAWDQARPRLGPLVGTALLVGLASYGTGFAGIVVAALLARTGTAGSLLAVPVVLAGAAGAVLLYVRWSLATAVVVLERQPVRRALHRSAVLVRRSFFRTLGVLLLAVVIAAFVGQVVQLPFQLVGYNPFAGIGGGPVRLTTGQALVGAVAGALATTLVAPFTAGVRALLYIDRRMRAEGLDIALVAQVRG